MVTKKKAIKEDIDIPINIVKVDKKEFTPFIKEGHIFETVITTKWMIDFNKVYELAKNHIKSNTEVYNSFKFKLNSIWNKYVNWLNWNFDNPCICPFMFIGEKEYPIFIGKKPTIFYYNYPAYKKLKVIELW